MSPFNPRRSLFSSRLFSTGLPLQSRRYRLNEPIRLLYRVNGGSGRRRRLAKCFADHHAQNSGLHQHRMNCVVWVPASFSSITPFHSSHPSRGTLSTQLPPVPKTDETSFPDFLPTYRAWLQFNVKRSRTRPCRRGRRRLSSLRQGVHGRSLVRLQDPLPQPPPSLSLSLSLSLPYPRRLTFTWWGCCGLCFWPKPTELADSFYPVLVSISDLMALSTVFHFINSPDNVPLSHSVLTVLFVPYWSFPFYISLNESLLQPWYNPLWLTTVSYTHLTLPTRRTV